jgi:hypothetical protein
MKSLPGRLIPLQELRPNQCKYPAQDAPNAIGGYLFCGRATAQGEIYCRQHKAICQPGRLAVTARRIPYNRSRSKQLH